MGKYKVRRWFYRKVYLGLKTRYAATGSIDLRRCSEKELKCLVFYGGIRPNKHNDWNTDRDIDFILSMKETKHLTEAQRVKMNILNQIAAATLSDEESVHYRGREDANER